MATPARGQDVPDPPAGQAPADAPAAVPGGETDPALPDASDDPVLGWGKRRGGGSPPAQQFADKFADALMLEIEVQSFEQSEVEPVPARDLPAYKRMRRQRIDKDAAEFRRRGDRISLKPLTLPAVADGVSLEQDEDLFLKALAAAYEASRTPFRLNAFMAANQAFLRTADWTERDKAIELREHILGREESWTRLFDEARALSRTGECRLPIPKMMDLLARLAPGAVRVETHPAKLILDQEDRRDEALAEVRDYLDGLDSQERTRRTTLELQSLVPTLHGQLIQASGLTELLGILREINRELSAVDAQLEDMGVRALEPTERKKLSRRKAELIVQQSQTRAKWLATPPAKPEAEALIAALDELIRGRMMEFGARAALHGHRYDEIGRTYQRDEAIPATTWLHLEAQHEMLTSLEEARPQPGLLAGIGRPPPLIIPAAMAKALLSKPGSATNLLKAIPKPRSKRARGKGNNKNNKKKRGRR